MGHLSGAWIWGQTLFRRQSRAGSGTTRSRPLCPTARAPRTGWANRQSLTLGLKFHAWPLSAIRAHSEGFKALRLPVRARCLWVPWGERQDWSSDSADFGGEAGLPQIPHRDEPLRSFVLTKLRIPTVHTASQAGSSPSARQESTGLTRDPEYFTRDWTWDPEKKVFHSEAACFKSRKRRGLVRMRQTHLESLPVGCDMFAIHLFASHLPHR